MIADFKRVVNGAHRAVRQHSGVANCSTDGFLISPAVRSVLIILFVLTDFATLFMLFDQILAQNVILALIFTFSATLTYNYLPIVISNEIHALKREKGHKPYLLVGYAVVFAVVIGLTVALRISTKDQLFTSVFVGSSEDYSSIMSNLSVSSDSITADLAVWIMAIIPVATSLISLYLSLKDDPRSVKLRKLIAARKSLENKLIMLTAQRAELDRDYEAELRSWDSMSRKAFLDREACEAENSKLYYLTLLMMSNKNPDAVNFLTEKLLRETESSYGQSEDANSAPDEF